MGDFKAKKFGPVCGKHGSSLFHKAFKYKKDGKNKIITLGQFFFMKILDSFPICIGELQLVWEDKNTSSDLASVRLYFLPESTPAGRQPNHGEEEVLAYYEKIVLKLSDLASLIVHDVTWSDGHKAFSSAKLQEHPEHQDLAEAFRISSYGLDNRAIEQERENALDSNDAKDISPEIIVMSYPQYCRYRCMMKRLENCADKWLRHALVCALGGFSAKQENNRVYFCRDIFEHADLDDFELRCDHLAPNLKGRPRKRKGSMKQDGVNNISDESSCSSSVSSQADQTPTKMIRTGCRATPLRNGFRIDKIKVSQDEQAFLIALHNFMKSRNTPIGRLPSLGFKQIDLYQFYKLASAIGGYEQISVKRMWKHLYDKLGGNPGFTSAATCTRRHYEKLLLPYELYQNGRTSNHHHIRKVKDEDQHIYEPLNHTHQEEGTVNEEYKGKDEKQVCLDKNDINIFKARDKLNETSVELIETKVKAGETEVKSDACKLLNEMKNEPLMESNKTLILKQEIQKMKMRKHAQNGDISGIDGAREQDKSKLVEVNKRLKTCERAGHVTAGRRPGSGKKTVRELLHQNWLDPGDGNKMKPLKRSRESIMEQMPVKTREPIMEQMPVKAREPIMEQMPVKAKRAQIEQAPSKEEMKAQINSNRKQDLKMDFKIESDKHQTVPGIIPCDINPLASPVIPLYSPTMQMYFPHMFPIGSSMSQYANMPFMAQPFGFHGQGSQMHALQMAGNPSNGLDKKPLLALNKLVAEQNDSMSHTYVSAINSPNKDIIMSGNSPTQAHLSSHISPPDAHQSSYMPIPKCSIISSQSESPIHQPITPAHSNHGKRQYPYLDTNRNLPIYISNERKHKNLSDKDLKRHKLQPSPSGSLSSACSSSDYDSLAIDLTMKTLQSQEACSKKGKSLLFNASFRQDSEMVHKSEPCDRPQDLSLKSKALHKNDELATVAHKSVPLNIPQARLSVLNSHSKTFETKMERSILQQVPSSMPLPIGSSSMVTNIGAVPIDLMSGFIHPAFPQQLLMPGMFPHPQQLQQMIQGQLAGMTLMRPDFVPNPLMFSSSAMSFVPPAMFSTSASMTKSNGNNSSSSKR